MRLLSLSLSSTSRGWHGKGPIWQPILAGRTGWKAVIHPMSWLLAQTLTCFPRCPRCPAALNTAIAAQPTLAGSSSPGSVCGTAVESFCLRMWLPTKLGTISTGTRRGWIFCWWRTPTSQQHPTWCRRSSMACSSGAQRVTLGNWALEKSSINGAPGPTASAAEGCWQSSWSRVLTHELPGGDPGKRGGQTDPVPTGHFAAGWRAKQQALCSLVLPALTAVILPGASAGHAAWDYVGPASPGGSLVGTERRKMLSDVWDYDRGGSSAITAASFCSPHLSNSVRV